MNVAGSRGALHARPAVWRVATFNIWNRQGPWDQRLPLIREGLVGGSGAGAASGTDRGARRLQRSMRAAPPTAAVGGGERWFTWSWETAG